MFMIYLNMDLNRILIIIFIVLSPFSFPKISIMANTALYERANMYNRRVENGYRDRWGSLLQYLAADDNERLIQMSDKLSN